MLGPQLFILYANDLIKMLTNCNVAQYADDTVLYTANVDFARSIDKMQADFKLLEKWCSTNGIMANTDKTKLMLFGSRKSVDKLPDFEIMLNETALKKVNSYKYLGITLDGQLKYDKHIQKVINIVSGILVQFRRMRSIVDL